MKILIYLLMLGFTFGVPFIGAYLTWVFLFGREPLTPKSAFVVFLVAALCTPAMPGRLGMMPAAFMLLRSGAGGSVMWALLMAATGFVSTVILYYLGRRKRRTYEIL